MIKFFTYLFLASSVFWMSCNDGGAKPESRQELIAGNDAFGKTWQISGIENEYGTVIPFDCVTDNYVTYYPEKVYEVREGATKCRPLDPPSESGSWSISSDETRLTISIQDSVQVWEIESINNNEHRISSQFKDGRRVYVFTSN